MRIALAGLAVRRPARVADADRAGQRFAAKTRLEVYELAFGAPALDVAVDQGGDAGRIVAAIFQALQRLDQQGGDGCLADDSDDAAHRKVVPDGGELLVFGPLGRRRAGLQLGTKRGSAPLLCDLARPAEGQGTGRDVLGDDAARRHVGAAADLHWRDQGAVGADERLRANHGAPLAVAIVVHGDRAGADVGGRADVGIAQIGQVVGLGAAAHASGLELDEVADMDLVGDIRARPDTGERADEGIAADAGAFDVAEGLDLRP